MKIDTDDWVALPKACKMAGIPTTTGYRLAKELGIVKKFFGVGVVRLSDVPKLDKFRRPRGNADWIASWDAAADAARKAVAARKRNKAAAEAS